MRTNSPTPNTLDISPFRLFLRFRCLDPDLVYADAEGVIFNRLQVHVELPEIFPQGLNRQRKKGDSQPKWTRGIAPWLKPALILLALCRG